jgi:hypothetical protein
MREGRRALRDGLAQQLALLRHLGLAPEPGAALTAQAGAPRY